MSLLCHFSERLALTGGLPKHQAIPLILVLVSAYIPAFIADTGASSVRKPHNVQDPAVAPR